MLTDPVMKNDWIYKLDNNNPSKYILKYNMYSHSHGKSYIAYIMRPLYKNNKNKTKHLNCKKIKPHRLLWIK